MVGETQSLPSPGGFESAGDRRHVHTRLERRPDPVIRLDNGFAIAVVSLAKPIAHSSKSGAGLGVRPDLNGGCGAGSAMSRGKVAVSIRWGKEAAQ